MTSRDGSNRNNRAGSRQPQGSTPRSNTGWELDADELDRFISDQPSQDRRFDPYQQQRSRGTAQPSASQPPVRRQQPTRQMRSQPVYEEPEFEAWDDDAGYEEAYYEPEPAPRQSRAAQQRPQPRRQPEPDYLEHDDDLYDDPYVMDDDEEVAPPRVQRGRPQQRRDGRDRDRARPKRQAPSFTMPKVVSDAAFVKDSTALIMAGTVLASLLAMLILVFIKRGDIGDMVFTHVNANGEPENLVRANAVWRLPIIGAAVAIINLSLAWFLSRWGNFLPRFLLGGTLAVHFVVWIAIIAYFF